MGALKSLIVGIALAVTPLADAAARSPWDAYVLEASARFGVPAAWIWRVMAIESAGRTMMDGRPIRSAKGAMGLMQLMPETWRLMRATYGLGSDPDDPHDNILAGAAYLRLMYDRFGYPGLFAAYNAGPGRYSAYLSGVARLPGETSIYVARATGTEPNAGRAATTGTAVRSVSAARPVEHGLFAVAPRSSPPPSPEPGLDRDRGSDPMVVIRRS